MTNPDNSEGSKDIVSSTPPEKVLNGLATLSSIAPWIGGPISNTLSGITNQRKLDRINSCLQELSLRIDEIHTKEAEEFVKTEDFEDILEQTLTRVAQERNEDKRKLYADFFRNNIANPELRYDRRVKMLKTLEELQPIHIAMIKAIRQEPSSDEMDGMMGSFNQTLSKRAPGLKDEIKDIAKDLDALGVTNNLGSSLMGTMTASGAADLRHVISDYGNQFISFLTR